MNADAPRRGWRLPRDPGTALLVAGVLGLSARLTVFLRQRRDGAFAQVDAAALAEIAIVGATAVVLLAGWSRVAQAVRALARRSGGWWLLYFAAGVATALQSLHASFSLFRAAEGLVMGLAVAVVLVAAPTFRRAERLALVLAWGTLLLDVVGRLKLGGFAWGDLASNSYSASAAMLACYSWGEALEARGARRTWLWGSAGAALLLLLTGMSLASWWSALAGLLLAGLVLRPNLPTVMLLLGLTVVAAGWGVDALETLVLRNRPVAEIGTFHGRLLLWQYYWEAFLARPWTGYGFAIGARMNTDIYTTHTHNALLSALLGLGVFGVALQAAAVWRFACEVVQCRRNGTPGWVGCTAALCCAGINSMAFACLGEGWMPATAVFAALLMLHSLWVCPRQY